MTAAAPLKRVWKMSKADLIDEIDARLAARGQSVAYPPRAARLRFSRTELENEVAALRSRHAPTADCSGQPVARGRCAECGADLCTCELAYGHDCEVSS